MKESPLLGMIILDQLHKTNIILEEIKPSEKKKFLKKYGRTGSHDIIHL